MNRSGAKAGRRGQRPGGTDGLPAGGDDPGVAIFSRWAGAIGPQAYAGLSFAAAGGYGGDGRLIVNSPN